MGWGFHTFIQISEGVNVAKRFYFLVQASTVKIDLSVCCLLYNGLVFLPKEVRSNLLNSCFTTKIRDNETNVGDVG